MKEAGDGTAGPDELYDGRTPGAETSPSADSFGAVGDLRVPGPSLIHHSVSAVAEKRQEQRELARHQAGTDGCKPSGSKLHTPSPATFPSQAEKPLGSHLRESLKDTPCEEMQPSELLSRSLNPLDTLSPVSSRHLDKQTQAAASAKVHEPPTPSKLGKKTMQDCNASNDWTSSLLSQSRNRQPLILGDNIFADLVGNWLDLPELEKKPPPATADGRSGHDHGPLLSRSQEFQKKLNLTANIFKKLLRSVRPDKGKLVKEKCSKVPMGNPGDAIAKRSSKASKQKVTFYFELRGNNSQNKKVQDDCGTLLDKNDLRSNSCANKLIQSVTEKQSPFDYNSVVWV